MIKMKKLALIACAVTCIQQCFASVDSKCVSINVANNSENNEFVEPHWLIEDKTATLKSLDLKPIRRDNEGKPVHKEVWIYLYIPATFEGRTVKLLPCKTDENGKVIQKATFDLYQPDVFVRPILDEDLTLPESCHGLFASTTTNPDGVPLSSIYSVDLAYRNTKNVTDMSCMFANCSLMESITISDLNTEKVTNMSGMFANCPLMESITLSNLNTENVTNMSGMFKGCTRLKTIKVNDCCTQNVTDMSGMFKGCIMLQELSLGSFDTKKVTNMSEMFKGCEGLCTIDLRSFDTEKVTNMSGMFQDCIKLREIWAKTFDTKNVTDMSRMFYSCYNIEFLTEEDVTNMINRFVEDHSQKVFSEDYLEQLFRKYLMVYHFNTEKVNDMSRMFSNCSKLTNLDLSNFNTKNVTHMRGMFCDCSNLKELDVSSFDTQNVTNMSDMFQGCKQLTKLDLSNFDTKNVIDMANMLAGCHVLRLLNISNFDVQQTPFMESMFAGDYKLEKVIVSYKFNLTDEVDMGDKQGTIMRGSASISDQKVVIKRKMQRSMENIFKWVPSDTVTNLKEDVHKAQRKHKQEEEDKKNGKQTFQTYGYTDYFYRNYKK